MNYYKTLEDNSITNLHMGSTTLERVETQHLLDLHYTWIITPTTRT
jgi:hypothetical protein